MGIDQEEEMIRKASLRFKHLELKQLNILEDELFVADYYICSGAMNIMTKEEMFLFIKRCFNFSQKAFIFNFLKNDSFNNVSKNEIKLFCLELTNNIDFKDNYLQNDMTICLKK